MTSRIDDPHTLARERRAALATISSLQATAPDGDWHTDVGADGNLIIDSVVRQGGPEVVGPLASCRSRAFARWAVATQPERLLGILAEPISHYIVTLERSGETLTAVVSATDEHGAERMARDVAVSEWGSGWGDGGASAHVRKGHPVAAGESAVISASCSARPTADGSFDAAVAELRRYFGGRGAPGWEHGDGEPVNPHELLDTVLGGGQTASDDRCAEEMRRAWAALRRAGAIPPGGGLAEGIDYLASAANVDDDRPDEKPSNWLALRVSGRAVDGAVDALAWYRDRCRALLADRCEQAKTIESLQASNDRLRAALHEHEQTVDDVPF